MAKIEKITTVDSWNKKYVDRKLPLMPDKKSWLGSQIFKELSKVIQKNENGKFLEAGCAPGKYGILFSKEFKYEISGFDYAPEGVALTKANWESLHINGDVFEADVFDLPEYLCGSFDVVLSAGFIEHFTKPGEIVEIFYGLMKERGTIVTIVPNTCSGLNMILMKICNPGKYKKLKETHLPINMKDLIGYHSHLQIINSRRIVGIMLASFFPSNTLISRIILRVLNGLLNIPAYLGGILQSDIFASHFMVMAKKIPMKNYQT